jgi:hypothetical protein
LGLWSASAPASRHACRRLWLGAHPGPDADPGAALGHAVAQLEPGSEPGDALGGRVLEVDQKHVAPAVAREPAFGFEVGLPALACAQLLDRGAHQLALFGATLLALLGCECSSCLGIAWTSVAPRRVRGRFRPPSSPPGLPRLGRRTGTHPLALTSPRLPFARRVAVARPVDLRKRGSVGRRVCSADRAQPGPRVLVAVQSPFLGPVAGPRGGQLEGDPGRDGGRHQRAAAAGAVLGKATVEVLGPAEVVASVAVGALEVQEIDDAHLRLRGWGPRGRGRFRPVVQPDRAAMLRGGAGLAPRRCRRG